MFQKNVKIFPLLSRLLPINPASCGWSPWMLFPKRDLRLGKGQGWQHWEFLPWAASVKQALRKGFISHGNHLRLIIHYCCEKTCLSNQVQWKWTCLGFFPPFKHHQMFASSTGNSAFWACPPPPGTSMQKEFSPWEVVCLKVIFHGGGEEKSVDQTFLTSCFVRT